MLRFSWFTFGTNPYTGKEDWLFNGEYWKRDWTRCPQIFWPVNHPVVPACYSSLPCRAVAGSVACARCRQWRRVSLVA